MTRIKKKRCFALSWLGLGVSKPGFGTFTHNSKMCFFPLGAGPRHFETRVRDFCKLFDFI